MVELRSKTISARISNRAFAALQAACEVTEQNQSRVIENALKAYADWLLAYDAKVAQAQDNQPAAEKIAHLQGTY